MFTMIQWDECYHPHSTDEKTERQEVYITPSINSLNLNVGLFDVKVSILNQCFSNSGLRNQFSKLQLALKENKKREIIE